MFSFIALGFCLVLFPCIAGIVSNSYDKKDNAGITFFATLLFGGIIFLVAVPAIATANSGPDHLRSSTPVQNVQSSVGASGYINYIYTIDGLPTTSASDDIDGILPSTTGKAHLDKVCDETPDWVVPYTMGTCHEYLYVPDFASK